MAKKVILMPLAEANYDAIITYLLNAWNVKVANEFIGRLTQVIGYIAKNPQMYVFVDKVKRVQKCVLTKQNVIYFVETEDVIKILAIFDSRQSPDKLLNII
jgi:plasmid stabilization system protein ParE